MLPGSKQLGTEAENKWGSSSVDSSPPPVVREVEDQMIKLNQLQMNTEKPSIEFQYESRKVKLNDYYI